MKTKNIIIEQVDIEESIEDVQPPPYNLESTFLTMKDWLLDICDSQNPKKRITDYALGIFESPEENIIFLVGLNKHGDKTVISFKPYHMYYPLQKSEYGELNRDQLINKLTIQLQEFTESQKFNSSFLCQANSILLNGTTKIWSK